MKIALINENSQAAKNAMIEGGEQCLRVAGMDVRNPVR